jgi:hypothetical protein
MGYAGQIATRTTAGCLHVVTIWCVVAVAGCPTRNQRLSRLDRVFPLQLWIRYCRRTYQLDVRLEKNAWTRQPFRERQCATKSIAAILPRSENEGRTRGANCAAELNRKSPRSPRFGYRVSHGAQTWPRIRGRPSSP